MLRARARPIFNYAASRVIDGLALACIRLTPPDHAYDWLVRLAGLIYALGARPFALLRGRPVTPRYRCMVLRDMLCVATRKGGIPIRVDIRGEGLLDKAYAAHGRVLLCTAHFGLTMAIFSALEARGLAGAAVGQVSDKRDRLHWGCSRPATLIESDRLCLVRARLALESGKAVVVMPERPRWLPDRPDLDAIGYDVDPNGFLFAAQIGVPVLFLGAELGPGGAISLDIVEPAHSRPLDETEAMALAEDYCRFLEARMGLPCRVTAATRDFLLPDQRRAA